MTYLQFHFVFTLPAIGLLLLLTWRDLRSGLPFNGLSERGTRFSLWAIAMHVALAILYTTPWDNYLVYREVWGYPPGRVLFTLGYVPFEEYLFFVLQAVLTSLFLFWLSRRWRGKPRQLTPERRTRVRVGGFGLFLLLGAFGVICLSFDWGTYLGLILVWAVPVFLLQWGYGGDLLLERWRFVATAAIIPDFYLWCADLIAIRLNIWWISPELSTGLKIFGLPIEESIFFVVTNLFLVFGLTLALHPESLVRFKSFKLSSVSWWKGAFALWALFMIPTPLLPDAFPVLAYLSTGFLALGVLGYGLERYGTKTFLLFGVAFTFGLTVEWLGKTVGVPFGAYSYTAPGPSLLGVPLLVPLGWWAFTLIAITIVPRRGRLWLAPLALVAWDLGLDPLMVEKGFWEFAAGGVYYGVPWTNFAGWYVSGLVLVWGLLRLEPRLRGESSLDLQLVFLAQAFLISVGLVFFGLPVAGVVTLVAMLSFSLPLLRYERRQGRLQA